MPRLTQWKETPLRTLTNLRGWRTAERLIVLESDDWGAIRMPGPAAFEAMLAKGIPLEGSRFDRFDCLESGEDLEALFDVLSKHVDGRGAPAVMTFNTVMGNPNFDRIRCDQFRVFHHEPFFDSYQRYHGQDLRGLWRSGMESGLIRPQFHAREHLNSKLWLRDLAAGRGPTRLGFDYGFYGVRTGTSSPEQRNYLAAYWAENRDDLADMARVLEEGMCLFEESFGFRSRSFVPCNYILPSELEPTLADCGIGLIQGQRGQAVPSLRQSGRLVKRRRYTGQRNRLGQAYSVRNVFFEPYADVTRDWVGTALREIRQAFRLRRPAVVVSHRINYVGGMDLQHRDRNLALLAELLARIRRSWPDVAFISSDQLGWRIQKRS